MKISFLHFRFFNSQDFPLIIMDTIHEVCLYVGWSFFVHSLVRYLNRFHFISATAIISGWVWLNRNSINITLHIDCVHCTWSQFLCASFSFFVYELWYDVWGSTMRMGVMFNSRATFQQRRKSNVRFLPLFRSISRSLSLSLSNCIASINVFEYRRFSEEEHTSETIRHTTIVNIHYTHQIVEQIEWASKAHSKRATSLTVAIHSHTPCLDF